jgi:hypothetical protein
MAYASSKRCSGERQGGGLRQGVDLQLNGGSGYYFSNDPAR